MVICARKKQEEPAPYIIPSNLVLATFVLNPGADPVNDIAMLSDVGLPMETGLQFNQPVIGEVGVLGDNYFGVELMPNVPIWPSGKKIVATATLQYFRNGSLVNTYSDFQFELWSGSSVFDGRFIYNGGFTNIHDTFGMTITIGSASLEDYVAPPPDPLITCNFLINEAANDPAYDQFPYPNTDILAIDGIQYDQRLIGEVGTTGDVYFGVNMTPIPAAWPVGKKLVGNVTLQYFKNESLLGSHDVLPLELFDAPESDGRYMWSDVFADAQDTIGMTITFDSLAFVDITPVIPNDLVTATFIVNPGGSPASDVERLSNVNIPMTVGLQFNQMFIGEVGLPSYTSCFFGVNLIPNVAIWPAGKKIVGTATLQYFVRGALFNTYDALPFELRANSVITDGRFTSFGGNAGFTSIHDTFGMTITINSVSLVDYIEPLLVCDFFTNTDMNVPVSDQYFFEAEALAVDGIQYDQQATSEITSTGSVYFGVLISSIVDVWPTNNKLVGNVTLQYFKNGSLEHTESALPLEMAAVPEMTERYAWGATFENTHDIVGLTVSFDSLSFEDIA